MEEVTQSKEGVEGCGLESALRGHDSLQRPVRHSTKRRSGLDVISEWTQFVLDRSDLLPDLVRPRLRVRSLRYCLRHLLVLDGVQVRCHSRQESGALDCSNANNKKKNAMRTTQFRGAGLLLAGSFLLTSCGGGGGGPALTLTLTPGSVSRTFYEGEAETFTVTGAVSGTVNGVVNVLIIDSVGVIQPNVDIQQIGDDYAATFTTATNLAAGSYTGKIAIRLCGGTPPACGPEYGSQDLGYNFTVQARPTPVVSSLLPSPALAEGPDFEVVVSGSNFFPSSVVTWDGATLPTTYVSGTELRAAVSAARIANPGPRSVAVATGPRIAAPLLYNVLNPLPVLTAVNPGTTAAGCGAFTLTLAGSGFVSSSVARWQGSPLVTTFVSGTRLRAAVPAGLIASAGSFAVTVGSSSPGGGSSVARAATVAVTLPPANRAVAYRITPGHTGVANSTCPDSLGETPLWDVELGGDVSYPLIADGKVFVTIQRQGIPDATTQVLALDQQTGAVAWGPFYVAGVNTRIGQGNAAYDDGAVFVTGDYDADLYDVATATYPASIQARSAATGAERWRKPLLPGGSSFVTAAPTAANGMVYANAQGSGVGGAVRAFRQTDGSVVWSVGTINGKSPPAVTGTGVYLAESCTTFGYNALTGANLWTRNAGCSGGSSNVPMVTGGIVYSPVPNFVTGPGSPFYDAATGVELGTFSQRTPSPIAGGTGYLLGYTFKITATNLATGDPLWTSPDGPTPFGSLDVAPILVDDRVIASDGAALWALDAATGALVWQVQTGGPVWEDSEFVPFSRLSGLGAGENLLVVPVGTRVRAYRTGSGP